MKFSDVLFALLALAAAGCFIALIVLQVMEFKFYKEDPRFGGNVWPEMPVPPGGAAPATSD